MNKMKELLMVEIHKNKMKEWFDDISNRTIVFFKSVFFLVFKYILVDFIWNNDVIIVFL